MKFKMNHIVGKTARNGLLVAMGLACMLVLGSQSYAANSTDMKEETLEIEVVLKGNMTCEMKWDTTSYASIVRAFVSLEARGVPHIPGTTFRHTDFTTSIGLFDMLRSCDPVEELIGGEEVATIAQVKIYSRIYSYTRGGIEVLALRESVTLEWPNGVRVESSLKQELAPQNWLSKWIDGLLPVPPHCTDLDWCYPRP